MAYYLSCERGEWILPLGTTIIGRGTQAHLRLNEPRLSRAHATLTVDHERCVLADAGSANGVFHNHQAVHEPIALNSGDTFLIGPLAFTLRADNAAHPVTLHCVREVPSDAYPAIDASPTEVPSPRISAQIASAIRERPLSHSSSATAKSVMASGLTPSPMAAPEGASALTDRITRPATGRSVSSFHRIATPRPDSERHTLRESCRPGSGKSAALTAMPQVWHVQADFQRRRIIAGIADVLQVAVLAWGGIAVVALIGLSGAAEACSVRVINGALVMPDLGGQPMSGQAVTMGWLLSRDGLQQLPDLWRLLWHTSSGSWWLSWTMLAALVAWLIPHLVVIAATVRSGAPFWHRRLGIAIKQHPDAQFCSWPIALRRWLLFGLTMPIAMITALRGTRSFHDRWSATQLTDRHRP